jgi:hypothetical protein
MFSVRFSSSGAAAAAQFQLEFIAAAFLAPHPSPVFGLIQLETLCRVFPLSKSKAHLVEL